MMTTAEIAETVAKLHFFTASADGIACSCGHPVADMREAWAHTQAMRDAAYRIQGEAEVSRAHTADPAKTCANGDGAIHYVTAPHGQGHYAHTATGERLCASTPTVATPVPSCPKCGGVGGWKVENTPWGIASDCADCGHHTYYSLGD